MPKDQLELPYAPITEIANRNIRRENSVRGRETYYVDINKIFEREGFNQRKEYTGIDDLAEFIEHNGLPAPLVVDMLPDGKCFIEQGHRRFRALTLLQKKGQFKKLDVSGVKDGKVECFINDIKVDELARLHRQYSSNKGEKYSTLENAEICKMLNTFFGKNYQEIGKLLAISGQSAKNYILIANQPDNIKQAIKDKHISPTAVLELIKKIENADDRADLVEEQIAKGQKVKVGDVGRVAGDKLDKKEITEDISDVVGGDDDEYEEEDDLGRNPHQELGNAGFGNLPASKVEHNNGTPQTREKGDKTTTYDESREEIKFVQNVIKNLDRINTIVSKLDVPDQTKKDLDRLIEFTQKDIVEVREWIHKNKKQNKR